MGRFRSRFRGRRALCRIPGATLEPNLGVVNADGGTGKEGRELGRTFVVADLPGLIEGAHEGAGLGMRFLRHVERTRLLVHLIDTSDMSDADPVHSFEVINGELEAFSESMTHKPMIVVATKLDATTDRARLETLREFCRERGLEFHAISAATNEGTQELVRSIANALDKIPKLINEPHPDADEAPTANDREAASTDRSER